LMMAVFLTRNGHFLFVFKVCFCNKVKELPKFIRKFAFLPEGHR
jgi:hypothetical protein